MSLNDDESNIVQKVYKSLTIDQLMGRCLKGRIQNTNKSVRSKLWCKKHKTKLCGLLSLQHAARISVAEHNFSFEQANVITQMILFSSFCLFFASAVKFDFFLP